MNYYKKIIFPLNILLEVVSTLAGGSHDTSSSLAKSSGWRDCMINRLLLKPKNVIVSTGRSQNSANCKPYWNNAQDYTIVG